MNWLAVDCETEGLYGKFLWVGYLKPDGTCGWGREEILPALRSEMEKADAIIFHNAKYDAVILSRLGLELPWEKVHDTLIAATLMVGSEEKSLLALSMKYLDYDGREYLEVDGFKSWSLIPGETLRRYTMKQLELTLCLWAMWQHYLPRQAYELERNLIRVLVEMEQVGVDFDVEKLSAIERDLNETRLQLHSKLESIARGVGLDSFNPASPKQCATVLHHLGIPLPRTKSGNPSTREDVLRLHEDNEFVASLLKFREVSKLLSSYVKTLRQSVSSDGKLYPQWSSTVTRTGRLSCSHPNLQNIAHNQPIRSAFYVPEGYRILAFDYRQIEFRLAVYLSGDCSGISDLENGIDPHTSTSLIYWGDEEHRKEAKQINFAIIYGVGIDTLARFLKCSKEEAADMLKAFFRARPDLERFRRKVLNIAERTGTVTLPNGRIIYLDRREHYKAFNYLIQGEAANVIKRAMLIVSDFLRPSNSELILQIHDELVIKTPLNEAEMILENVPRLMTSASEYPMEVEASEWFGSWGNEDETVPF